MIRSVARAPQSLLVFGFCVTLLFGTDAYPYSNELGWEESGWLAARTGREALARALTAMLRDGEISRPRASDLARMVLRENARALYGLP